MILNFFKVNNTNNPAKQKRAKRDYSNHAIKMAQVDLTLQIHKKIKLVSEHPYHLHQ